MTWFAVPELPADAFAPHYRRVIRGALLRSAEARHELHLEQGHRLRARRAERVVLALRRLDAPIEPDVQAARATEREPPAGFADRFFSSGSRAVVRAAWLVTLALLVADVVLFGIRSWQTGVADVGLIVLTFLWFAVSVEDLTGQSGSPAHQLRLFE